MSRIRDLLRDVTTETASRRSRALLMVASVGLATGALVASLGIATTAASQINADIAASTLDLVQLQVVPPPVLAPGEHVLPEDADARAQGVDLVEAAGRRLNLTESAPTRVTRTGGAEAVEVRDVAVVGVSTGYLRAAQAQRTPELSFWMDDPAARVALLGPGAAKAAGLPVTGATQGLRIWVDAVPYDVVGYVAPDGPAALDDAVVIPYAAAVDAARGDQESTMLVRTSPGAGAQVAPVIAQAVRPDAPERLAASPVVSLQSLRQGVSTQLDRLSAWIGGVLLALSVLLIANSMVVAVGARTGEIGLRRALGSSRRDVAAVFLGEGGLVDAVGGIVGTAFAAVAVLVTALVNRWDAAVEPWQLALGPLLGLAVGLVASAYPALRASRISPAIALRAD